LGGKAIRLFTTAPRAIIVMHQRQFENRIRPLGRGHLLQLRDPVSDGGLSNFGELALQQIAGGVVDRRAFTGWA
jgi:hypothetical protein